MADIGLQDDKFIAANANGEMWRLQFFAQPSGDRDKQRVSHCMTKAVIDVLEPIQVETMH